MAMCKHKDQNWTDDPSGKAGCGGRHFFSNLFSRDVETVKSLRLA